MIFPARRRRTITLRRPKRIRQQRLQEDNEHRSSATVHCHVGTWSAMAVTSTYVCFSHIPIVPFRCFSRQMTATQVNGPHDCSWRSCAMAAAGHDMNNNTARSGSVSWQRPRRVHPARHIHSTEVTLNFGRVTAEFCLSDCSPDQLTRIFHMSYPPKVFIWSVKLNNATLYIVIPANAIVSARVSQPVKRM